MRARLARDIPPPQPPRGGVHGITARVSRSALHPSIAWSPGALRCEGGGGGATRGELELQVPRIGKHRIGQLPGFYHLRALQKSGLEKKKINSLFTISLHETIPRPPSPFSYGAVPAARACAFAGAAPPPRGCYMPFPSLKSLIVRTPRRCPWSACRGARSGDLHGADATGRRRVEPITRTATWPRRGDASHARRPHRNSPAPLKDSRARGVAGGSIAPQHRPFLPACRHFFLFFFQTIGPGARTRRVGGYSLGFVVQGAMDRTSL